MGGVRGGFLKCSLSPDRLFIAPFVVMLTPLYLLIGLTVATCVIAYWADNLGKKLGKKRISLFGLRPRQTATLISMASSVGIMMLTLVVLIAFNSSLRRALFRYDYINSQNQDLTFQAVRLQGQVNGLKHESNTLRKDNTETRRLREVTNRQLQGAKRELQNVKSDLGDAREKLVAAQEGETAAKQNEKRAVQQTSVARSRFAAAENRLEQTLGRLRQVDVRLVATRKGLTQVKTQLTRAQTNLVHTRAKLHITNLKLDQTQIGTVQTLASLRQAKNAYEEEVQAVARLQVQVEQQKAEVTQLETQQKELEANIQLLSLEADKLYAVAAPILTQGDVMVMIRSGQVLAAQTIPARTSHEQVQDVLEQLIANANKAVKNMGGESLQLAPIGIGLPGSRPVVLGKDEILDRLANYLTTFDVPVSVRLVATRFHAKGEKEVLGRMVTLPVRSTFTPGEEIVSTTIDGAQSDARIFNQLLKVVNDGEQNARERGMQPLLTDETPNFYAGETNERIFEALRRIQKLNGPAKVSLVASANLTTIDQLRVRFEVSKQG